MEGNAWMNPTEGHKERKTRVWSDGCVCRCVCSSLFALRNVSRGLWHEGSMRLSCTWEKPLLPQATLTPLSLHSYVFFTHFPQFFFHSQLDLLFICAGLSLISLMFCLWLAAVMRSRRSAGQIFIPVWTPLCVSARNEGIWLIGKIVKLFERGTLLYTETFIRSYKIMAWKMCIMCMFFINAMNYEQHVVNKLQ